MEKSVRWGILGTGSICRAFAQALRTADGAELVAVGSRARETAREFAEGYGLDRAHGTYEGLAADPEVDVVYIGTPHSRHAQDAQLCLRGGKHVLCEKPFALNAEQARAMVATAREHDRLLMEAMWTRFLPSSRRLRELLAEGVIGEPRLLAADFGIRPAFDPRSRLFDPELGGGALLDLGVYAMSLANWLFGPPARITGVAAKGPTGVDDDSAFILIHAAGEITTAYQSLRVDTPREAVVRGTCGSIRLHEPWWGATRLTIHPADGEPEMLEFELKVLGYGDLAEAFTELVRSGSRDSQVMPLDESVEILAGMDALRAQWGLAYPGE